MRWTDECVLRCIVVLCTLLFCLAPTHAQQRADFFVVEKPHELAILDQYQQQLTAEEKSALVPFSPFHIIAMDDSLADHLTHCMKTSLNGRLFYLLKEDSGRLVGAGTAGVQKLYRNVKVLQDTIGIVKGGAVQLLDMSQRKRTPLGHGARLVRVFESRRLTFVQLVSSGTFGWADLHSSSNWTKTRDERASYKTLGQLVPEIQLKISAVNSKLVRLYEIFNAKSTTPRTPPEWQLQTSETSVVCTLKSTSSVQFFEESTRWLDKEIESLLLGTQWRASSAPGRIEVR